MVWLSATVRLISGILKLIMTEGRLSRSKCINPQKAHQLPLRDVCMQYKRNPPMGFRDLPRKPNADRRPEQPGIQGDAITARPTFFGRGIKKYIWRLTHTMFPNNV